MAKEKSRWENQKILRTNSRPCSFCKECDDVEVLFGIFYTIGKTNCHHYCLLLSSRLKQNGQDEEGIEGFLHQDIATELKRASSRMCYYCGRNNATLNCHFPDCSKVFHLPCGRRNGALNLFHDQFQSYCALHRPVQRVPTSILTSRPLVTPGSIIVQLPRLSTMPELERLTIGEASKDVIVHQTRESTLATTQISSEWHTCGICYDKVTPLPTWNTLWPPCCKGDRWFHRICVAKLALSAGRHYVKCPLCNNQPIFLATLLKFGFYVPDRDASWEREDGAFRELHERPKECYVPKCLSNAGRHYSGSKIWQLVICNLCGSQAAHRRCADLKLNRSLICSRCQPDQPQPRAFDEDARQEIGSSEDAFITWREDTTNSARDRRDSVISVQGSSSGSAGTCEAYLTMNNDLIIKTDKENVFSVRSIDSAIIKSLSPKKGELTTNDRSSNTILEKLLNGSSSRNSDCGSSVDQILNQTEQYVILNEAPEESVKKPASRRSIRRESVYSNVICLDDSDNTEEVEESVKQPAPRRSIRRQSVFSSRMGIDESDSKEESVKQSASRRSIRRQSVYSSRMGVEESDGKEDSVKQPASRRSIRRQSVYSSRMGVEESDGKEESVKHPASRHSIRRESVYSNRMCINESDSKEESVQTPVSHSSIYRQSTSSTSVNKEATAESDKRPALSHPIRRKSICASRFYTQKTDNRIVTRDDLEVGKRLSNENTVQKSIASYFNNPVKKSVKLEEISSNADAKKQIISSTNKYNGGKFKVKISPSSMSSKYKKHEKNVEQSNISSGRDTFKDKVEKYFQQLEELRNKTTLNTSPVFNTEQPLRIVFKVEGYLSKNAGAPSKKRKRPNEVQSQNKKAKNNKIVNKPCPKSKKLFYVENEEITNLTDKMDVEEEASVKYKIINDEYAKVITSRRVFTVPIPKCPGDKSKKKDKEKRKSAETGQTNIMSYFQTINVKKEPTTLINTQVKKDTKPDEKFPKAHLNQVDKSFGDIKRENLHENMTKKMIDNSNSPSKQLDEVSNVRDKDFHEFVVNNCVELLGMSGERKPRKKMSQAAQALKNAYRTKRKKKKVTEKKEVLCERNPIDGRFLKLGSAESELVKKYRKNYSMKTGVVANDNLVSGISFSYKEAVQKVSPNNVPHKEVVKKKLPDAKGNSNGSKIDLKKSNVSESAKECDDTDMKSLGERCENGDLANNVDFVNEKGNLEPEISEKKKLDEERDDLVNDSGKQRSESEQGDLVNDIGKKKSKESDLLNATAGSEDKNDAASNVTCDLPVSRTDLDEDIILSQKVNLIVVPEAFEPLQNVDVDEFINGSEISGVTWQVIDEIGESDESFINDEVETVPEKQCSNRSKDADLHTVDEIKDLNKGTEEEKIIDEINDLPKDAELSKNTEIHNIEEIKDLTKDAELSENTEIQNIDKINELPKDAELFKNTEIQNVDKINGLPNDAELFKNTEIQNIDKINDLPKDTELFKNTEIQNIDKINDLPKDTELFKNTEVQNIDKIHDLPKDAEVSKNTEIHNIVEIKDLTKDARSHTIDEINDLSEDGKVYNNLVPTTVLQENDEINDSISGNSLPKNGNELPETETSDVVSLLDDPRDEIVYLLYDSDTPNNEITELNDVNKQNNDKIVSLLYDSDSPNEITKLNDVHKQTNDDIVSPVGETNDECILILEDDDDEDIIPTPDETNKILKEYILRTDKHKKDANFDVTIDDLIKKTVGKLIQNVDTIDLCDNKEKILNKSENDLSKSPLSKKYNDSKIGYSTNSSFSAQGNVLNVRRHAKRVIKLETPYVEEIIETNDVPNTTTKDTLTEDYIKVDKVKRYGLFTRKDSDSDVSITREKHIDMNKKGATSDQDCFIVNDSVNTKENGVDANKNPNSLDEDCVIVNISKKRKRKHQKFKSQDSSMSETDVTQNKNKNSGFVVNDTLSKFSVKSANETPSFSDQGFRRDFWKVTSYSNIK